MEPRYVDHHRRITLPKEIRERYFSGQVYFRKDSTLERIQVMNVEEVVGLKEDIEFKYGVLSSSNKQAREVARQIASSIVSHHLEESGRVVLPHFKLEERLIMIGDKLEFSLSDNSVYLERAKLQA